MSLFWAVVCAAAVLGPAAGGFFGWRYWKRYVAERETAFQPAILMAIANESSKMLGPPFMGERRIGDWTIMEEALLRWSKNLRGFALKGFCRIFEENGFAEYERGMLGSMRAERRAMAAQRLGRMFHLKAVPELVRALEDGSPEVRRMASWALANMGQTDAPGHVVTTAQPQGSEGIDIHRKGSVSGRFYWEDGDPVVVTDREENLFLLRKSGGMEGVVHNLPRMGPGRKPTSDNVFKTYRDGYVLHWIDTRYPAAVKAVLRQPIGGYYYSVARKRRNIPVREGCVSENIDFVFPRFAGHDDRVSVMGGLLFLDEPERKERNPKTVVTLDGIEADFWAEFLCYQPARDYRLHDVPPGKYRLRASYSSFSHEGIVIVPRSQPMTFNIKLERR